MKRLLFVFFLLTLLFAIPVYADEPTEPPTETQITYNVEVTDYSEILNEIKTIQLENQELLAQQTAGIIVIMYIVAMFFFMIYAYLLFVIIRKIAKVIGFGLL